MYFGYNSEPSFFAFPKIPFNFAKTSQNFILMKALKIVGYILVGLLAIVLIVPLLIPAHYSVSRSSVVNAPVDVVYGQVVSLKNWGTWDPWAPMDPNMKVEYTGTDGDVGSTRHWVGNDQVGEGIMTLTKAVPNKEAGMGLKFMKPMEGENGGGFTFEAEGDKTKVTWTLTGEGSYPIGRFFNLLMDGFIGKDFERGLKRLDSVSVIAHAAKMAEMAAMSQDTSAGNTAAVTE